MRNMVRGIIDSVVEGAIKRCAMKGFVGETISDKEYFQHYGFTSRPLKGAEGVMIREGNHWILIGSDDRRYRIQLQDGEVALNTDEGDVIHFKRGQELLISSGNKVVVNGSSKVEVNAPEVIVTASTKVKFVTPLVECTGNFVAGGNVSDSTGSMAEVRSIYNVHDHDENDNGGPTGNPNQSM